MTLYAHTHAYISRLEADEEPTIVNVEWTLGERNELAFQ